MLRLLLVLAVVAILAGRASAHFLFVHVLPGEDPRVELHFAESCWDFSADQRMVGIMSDVRAWDPRHGTITFSPRPHAMIGELSEDGTTACAAFTYGIMRRGTAFLLEYHAKGVSGLESAATPSGLEAEILATREGDELVLTVLFRGEPAPGAEIVVPMQGTSIQTLATAQDGTVRIPFPSTPLYSIRAMVAEDREGVHDDVEYDQARHYTTLTVHPNPDSNPVGSDALATALLADALECQAAFPADGRTWSGRLQGRFADEEIRGNVNRDDSGLGISLASSASTAARTHLPALEAVDDAGCNMTDGARFPVSRSARVDATVMVPEAGKLFIIRDRRIESVVSTDDSGSRRIDTLAWETTEDQRFLPTRLLVTDFDESGAIRSVMVVETDFVLQDGVHVPQGHSGTVIDGPSEGNAFSLKVNDVRIK